MLRVLVAIMAMAALALPAMAYDEPFWDGNPEGDILIDLQIDCWIQIDRQDTAISFTDQSPFDWFSETMTGVAYARCPDGDSQHPMYPWAGDHWYATNGMYYEADDGAQIYIQSNNDLTMNVIANGDLTGTINGPPFATIPTWFTVAACPFEIGGVALTGHSIPFCGNPGCYLGETGAAGVFTFCDGGGDFPSQHMFPCTGGPWTTNSMAAQISGTVKFLARIHRNGMMRLPGDHYMTSLNVNFTSP